MDEAGWKVKEYSVHNSEQSQGARKFFIFYADLLKNLCGNDPVTLIDIGSGCGHVLVEIILKDSQLNISQVVGIDKCIKMVNFSNEKYGNEKLKFHLMDIQDSVPKILESSKFDILTSFFCLHWITDMKKAFSNINSLLNPGGLFLCVFLHSHFLFDIWDVMAEKYSPYFNKYRSKFSKLNFMSNGDEIIKQYLSECGFEVVKFIDEKKDMFDFKSEENIKVSFEVVNPCLNAMSETLREEYLKDQISVIYKMQAGMENPFDVKRRIFYFIAKKL